MSITLTVNDNTTPPPGGGLTIGAETLAGQGGIVTAGSAITAGDPNVHWQITGGRLEPTAAGASAKMNDSPYSLTITGVAGTTDITTVANRKDVKNTTEFRATYPGGANAATSGQTVGLRGGTYDVGTGITAFSGTSGLTDYVKWENLEDNRSDVQLEYDNGSRKGEIRFTGSGTKYLEINGCQINHNHNPTFLSATPPGAGNNNAVIWVESGGRFKIIDCDIISDLLSWWDGGLPQYECTGVEFRGWSNFCEARGCDISGVVHGCRASWSNDLIFDGNNIHDIWGDAIQCVTDQAPVRRVQFSNNTIWNLVGSYAYLHQDGLTQTWGNNQLESIHVFGNVVFPGDNFYKASPACSNDCDVRTWDAAQGNFITTNQTLSGQVFYEVVATGSPVTITLAAENNRDVAVARRPESTADVIVQATGGDTIDNSGTPITLTGTGKVAASLQGQGNGNWASAPFGFGPLIQGTILQQFGGLHQRDLRVHDNIIYANNKNAVGLGAGGASGPAQQCSGWHNSVIEIIPKDNNGDGQVDNYDGVSNSGPECFTAPGSIDGLLYNNVAVYIRHEPTGFGQATHVGNLEYTWRNGAAQDALWANRVGSIAQPETRAQAISEALVQPAGSLVVGSEYIGAVGTTAENGPWDFTNKQRNPSYNPNVVVSSSTPSDGATGVAVGVTLYITFSHPVFFGTSGSVRLMNGGSEITSFDVVSDQEDATDTSQDGTAGSCHREGFRFVFNPTSNLPSGTVVTVVPDAGALVDGYERNITGTILTFTTA